MEDLTAIILAGGQSRRMGGGDKCLLPLGDRPVLAEIIARIAPQAVNIVLSANGDPSRFAAFGLPVVADTILGSQGPLAGIEAGLSWAGGEGLREGFAVTVPGDTPFIPSDLVSRLAAGLGDRAMAVAKTDAGLHPVVGLWPLSMAQVLREALAQNMRKASQFVREQGAAEVVFEPIEIGGERLDPFFNVNTPDDLSYARTLVGRQSA